MRRKAQAVCWSPLFSWPSALKAPAAGRVFDFAWRASGVFTGSGLLLLTAMVIVFTAVRVKPVASAEQPVTGRLSREIDN